MLTSPNRSTGFRRQLHTEVQSWQAEGLISGELAATLEQRYDLNTAGAPALNRFTLFLYALGGLMVGLGLVLFVAWNYTEIPDAVKVVGLLALMLTFQGVGYHWSAGPRPAAGHGLLVLGALTFGASIGVFGQIFNTDGSPASGFGLWALGCTALAYAAGSIPVMLLAVIASTCAFFGGMLDDHRILWSAPILIGLQGVPFALRYRSSTVLSLTLILLTLTQITAVGQQCGSDWSIGASLVCGILMVMGGTLLLQDRSNLRMGRIAMFLGLLALSTPLFLISIGEFAREIANASHYINPRQVFSALLTGLLGVISLVFLGPLFMHSERSKAELPLVAAAFVASLVTGAALVMRAETPIQIAGLFGLTLMTFVMVWVGLVYRNRVIYTLGTLFIGSRLITYFLLSSADSLTRSAVMVVGGVAIIAAALQYERWVKRFHATTNREI